jgi:hypothetical protein
MEYVYGVPHLKRSKRGVDQPGNDRERGVSWCQRPIEAAADWHSAVLIDFLSEFMLIWNPQERLSAAACLKKATELGLFHGMYLNLGTLTPALGRILSSFKEEAPTIILGSLWQHESKSFVGTNRKCH